MPRRRRDETLWLTRVGHIWYIRSYDPATRSCVRRSTGCRDRADAERVLARQILGAAPARPAQADHIAVADCLTRYLEAAAGNASAEQALIAVGKYLLPAFGAMTVAELRPPIFDAFIAARRDGGLSDSYISRLLAVLRAAVRKAHRDGRLETVPHIPALTSAPPRERWLSRDEAARLITACTTPHLRRYVVLAIGTAARPSALLALDWGQVDIAGARLFLRPPGARQTHKRKPVVALSPAVIAELSATPVPDRCGPVIAYHGRAVASVKKALARAAASAGIEGVTPYVLRHTALSWMAQAGVPLAEIAQAAGHTSSRMIERHYLHWTPEHTARAIAVTGSFLADFWQAAEITPPSTTPNTLISLVEPTGIEPVTSTMPLSRKSAQVVDIAKKMRSRKGRK